MPRLDDGGIGHGSALARRQHLTVTVTGKEMVTMWRKGCPKCGGDLFEDRWVGQESDIKCIQCGWAVPTVQAAPMLAQKRARGRQRRRVTA